jgi:hypothetical protein
MDTNYVLFEVMDELENDQIEEDPTSESCRVIKYHLGPEFLELKNLGSLLTFSVDSKPVNNLLMIERHYFK